MLHIISILVSVFCNSCSCFLVIEMNLCLLEPGFYEDGKFGIRIENLMLAVKANTKVIVVLLVYCITYYILFSK